ncbi:MAG TPA: hypothetical protein V6C86_08895 [Oculatellaceae cyanobacterium]
MTVSKFSDDQDAKWTIGLVALSLVLVLGWLINAGNHKEEPTAETSGALHSP